MRPLSPFSPGVKLAIAVKIPNLFNLELCEPVAYSFFSSDCNSLSGVVSEFGVHWLRFAHQQIGLAVLTSFLSRPAGPS